jgi:pimeloyl-ACP methyl ester carboxylesterase
VIPHLGDVLPAGPPDAVFMPNAIVNGITIDYSTAGDGPPVLLICGTGQPADLWFAQVTDLAAAGHTVITFDNRGCGRSEAPPAPYSVTGMAADTAALIEHLGLGPCDVIGYSLGGYIAQELAVTRADLVRRLVLLAGAGPAPAYAVARARAAVDLARALDPLPPSFDVADLLLSLHPMAQLQNDDDAVKVTISLIEAAEQWANPGRLGQYQADLAWLEDSGHLDRLDRIKSPCLAMAFEHDCWFPPRAVRAAAERIPSCQYTELPGLGHGAPLLAAGQVNSILAAFLD